MKNHDLPELTAIEKRAYLSALNGSCMDESFLSQFEGTPLYPQAIALAEQELAMEQRQLQQRMQQAAQRSMENFDQFHNEREGIELQKKQLLIQMHKMKVMGQGAPTPPGQAVIGTPDPAAQQMAAAAAPPAEDPTGGDPSKMASLRKFAQRLRSKSAAVTDDAPQVIPELIPGGSTYVGLQRGALSGKPIEGAVRGALGGTAGGALGLVPGQLLAHYAARKGNLPVAGAGEVLGSLGAIGGGALGTHLATRGLIPAKDE